MLNDIPLRGTYSSTVTLSLVVDGQTIALARVGPSSIAPQDNVVLPEKTTGQVRMTIDGRLHVWDVMLPHGAVPFKDIEVEYVG